MKAPWKATVTLQILNHFLRNSRGGCWCFWHLIRDVDVASEIWWLKKADFFFFHSHRSFSHASISRFPPPTVCSVIPLATHAVCFMSFEVFLYHITECSWWQRAQCSPSFYIYLWIYNTILLSPTLHSLITAKEQNLSKINELQAICLVFFFCLGLDTYFLLTRQFFFYVGEFNFCL